MRMNDSWIPATTASSSELPNMAAISLVEEGGGKMGMSEMLSLKDGHEWVVFSLVQYNKKQTRILL